MVLFDNVLYHLSPSLPENTRLRITALLDQNGARSIAVDRATHIISNTIDFEGYHLVKESAVCVTPYWVERTIVLGQRQEPKQYSADRAMIFSGIVAASANLPPGDTELISSGIIELGGGWRDGLTKDVTHLFVTSTSSDKYKIAHSFREQSRITILLPQWFDQCWSQQTRLPTKIFEFPEPLYFTKQHDSSIYREQVLEAQHIGSDPDRLPMDIDKSLMLQSDEGDVPAPSRVHNVWEKRTVLLSSSLELDPDRKTVLHERIEKAGGVAIRCSEEDESERVVEADVLVTRFRTGPVYANAFRRRKTIGSFRWFLSVDKSGVFISPRDNLLHYPVRTDPIPGFSAHEITVTNYTGAARDYLKRLIELMGATFTPTLSGRNTVVVAAHKTGTKTAKADEWSIPVVNHKWLEDCFVEWRNLTPAQKSYVDYTSGLNYSATVGQRSVGRIELEEPKPSPKPAPTLPNGEKEALEVDEVDYALDFANDDARRKSASPSKSSPIRPRMVPTSNGPAKSASTKGPPSTPSKMTSKDNKAFVKQGSAQSMSKTVTAKPSKARREDTDDDLSDVRDSGRNGHPSESEGQNGLKRKALTEPKLKSNQIKSSKKHSTTAREGESDREMEEAPVKAATARKRRHIPSPSPEDEEHSDEVETKPTQQSLKGKARESPRKYKSNAKAKTRSKPEVESDTESDTDLELFIPDGTNKAKAKNELRPSQALVTVELPSKKTTSVKEKERAPPVKSRPRSDSTLSDGSVAKLMSIQRTPSRRSAAKTATRRLRDEVMPDVITFEKEVKRKNHLARRRKSSLGVLTAGEEEEEEEEEEHADRRPRKKTKTDKARKGSSVSTGSKDSYSGITPDGFITRPSTPINQSSDEDIHTLKSNSFPKKSKASIVQSDIESVDADSGETGTSTWKPRSIRILTTKVEVSENIENALTKLGVKFTTKYVDCTHLVADALARTEKFLCALSQAPVVLNSKWLKACADARCIVAEHPYFLTDPEMEKKHGFKLSEALERARTLKKQKKKLLDGHFFYFTPNVPVDHNLLKNVLKSLGAEAKDATPTARSLTTTRHVISCAKDEPLWRPLVKQGKSVFSQELILSAAFRQLVDWDSDEMYVPGAKS